MTIILRIAAFCAAMFAAGTAFAQTYPNRFVRIIVPFPAGGPTDVMARLIGQKLSEKLGQQFVVENIGGAGGNIGMGNAAKAAGDGYTILFVSSSYVVNPSLYHKVPYDPDEGLRADHQGGRRAECADRPSVGPGAHRARSWSRSSRRTPRSSTSLRPASARRRIFRSSCSSRRSGSTISPSCRSSAAIRRSRRSSPDTRRSRSRRSRRRPP